MGRASASRGSCATPPDEPVAEVEIWPKSSTDEIEIRKMTKTTEKASRERIARGHLDWGRERFARDMEPELFSLEDPNHKPFGTWNCEDEVQIVEGGLECGDRVTVNTETFRWPDDSITRFQ